MTDSDKPVVLLVEDNPDHAELIKRSLARTGSRYRIVHVEDGEAALNYLQHTRAYADPDSAPPPSLILLDLRLPRVDGLHVLKTLKHSATLRHIPVVVLSTSEAERDIAAAYEWHANSYIVKPAGYEHFQAMVQALTNYWLDWHRAC